MSEEEFENPVNSIKFVESPEEAEQVLEEISDNVEEYFDDVEAEWLPDQEGRETEFYLKAGDYEDFWMEASYNNPQEDNIDVPEGYDLVEPLKEVNITYHFSEEQDDEERRNIIQDTLSAEESYEE